MKKLDLSGERYGRLTAIRELGKTRHNKTLWECLCDCGNLTQAVTSNLRNGHTKSCGCLNREVVNAATTKHGLSHTSEYEIWKAIIQRCTNQNHKQYPDYGGRGITVCAEWANDFKRFYDDMGPRPSKAYSVERIDNNLGYSPDNCKWATNIEQGRNRRVTSRSSSGVHGVTWHKRDKRWIAAITNDGKIICLGSYKDLDKAIQARKQAEEKYWNKKPS